MLRLLNDVGDDQDQLPLLQHALMRTWDHWQRQHGRRGEPIDLADYEAVGTLRNALSLHAEEAYQETGSERGPADHRADVQGADRHVLRSARRPASDVGRRAGRDLRGRRKPR